jgi:dolichol-phosphate mannosyltransferase
VSAASPAGGTWVILPTYDEAENVEAMLEAVLATLDGAGIAGRVLVVDDASPDGTADLAEAGQAGDRARLPGGVPPRPRRGRGARRRDGLRLLP